MNKIDHISPPNYQKRQGGVVLFIALIALVVMSLAAVALIRSVDTNSMISGNLSFKQAATTSADSGFESAIIWFQNPLNTTNLTLDSSANQSLGYYATCTAFDLPTTAPNYQRCAGTNLSGSATWNPGVTSAYAAGTGITSGVDASGNTIQYVIERMCSTTGAPSTDNCLLATTDPAPSSQAECSYGRPCPPNLSNTKPTYRVTARVTGPKNTVAYIQTFIY